MFQSRVTTNVSKYAKTRCLRHGKTKWAGEIICEKCMRIYLRAENDTYPDAPDSGNCACGVRLFPVHDADGKVTKEYFSARIICTQCARMPPELRAAN